MLEELGTELLRSGYGVRFRATGQSMNPTIRDGEAITVEPISPEDMRRGDIILYRTAKGFIAHRIILIEKDDDNGLVFIPRGDASATCDAPVSFEQVLGRVESSEHFRVRWLNALRRNVSYTLLQARRRYNRYLQLQP